MSTHNQTLHTARALPWDDLKVCFGCGKTDGLWRAREASRLQLPEGWELDETDISGAAGYVAIFRVNVFPTATDAYKVKAQLRRFAPYR